MNCPHRPVSDDLSCVLPDGHDGHHRNFQGIHYRSAIELAERDDAQPGRHRRDAYPPEPVVCGARHPRFGAACSRPAGHPDLSHRDHALGITWHDEQPSEPVAEVVPRQAGKTAAALERALAELEEVRRQRDTAERTAEARGEYLDHLEARVNRALSALEGREEAPEKSDAEPAPCDARLTLDYGDQGQTLGCALPVAHPDGHQARADGVTYRWPR